MLGRFKEKLKTMDVSLLLSCLLLAAVGWYAIAVFQPLSLSILQFTKEISYITWPHNLRGRERESSEFVE